MAVFDLTAADPLMKINFNPRIIKQFNTAAVLYNRFFDAKGTAISNRGLEIPIHTGPNAAFQWYSDGGTLPAGDSQKLNRASVGFFSYAHAVQFTGAALDAAGDDAVTYARALAFNIKNCTEDAIKTLNIYSFLDGTGILAQVGGIISTSLTLNTTVDLTGNADNGRYLRPGMVVDIMTGSVAPVKATATVLSMSTAPGNALAPATMVLGPATAAVALAVGDAIVVTGSLNNVMAGMKLIVDDGTIAASFQSVNRSTVPIYQANVLSVSASAPLSRDHLRRGMGLIQIARGSVDPSNLEIWSHPSQLHSYMDMGWTLKRFSGSASQTLDLGYTTSEWEGISWTVDTDAPKDHIFMFDRSSMLKVRARDLSFDDRTGSVLRQVPSSTAGRYTDAFVAFLLFRGNIGTYSPNSNVKIKGLGVPSGY